MSSTFLFIQICVSVVQLFRLTKFLFPFLFFFKKEKKESDIVLYCSELPCHYSGVQRHPLRPYLDYIGFLYQRMDPIPDQERFEVGYALILSPHIHARGCEHMSHPALFFSSNSCSFLCQLGYRDFLQSPLQVHFYNLLFLLIFLLLVFC